MKLKNLSRFFLALSVAAALPLALSACAIWDEEEESAEVSQVPAPPDQSEVAPLLENPQTEIWRPGYWAPGPGEFGQPFVWIPGEILARPAPTAVWAKARWVRHAFGWTFQEGHWE